MSINKSGIRPVEYMVVVEPKRVEEKTAGGLYIPDSNRDKEQFGQKEGRLVAASPHAFSYAKEWPKGTKPQVGDRVLFMRYQGDEVKGQDGESYWLLKDASIMAVLENG